MEIPARFEHLGDRRLSADERDLMTHVTMFGSAGYPIAKLGRKWWWKYRDLQAAILYPTKTKAVESFEAYYDVLRDVHAYESWLRDQETTR